MNLDLPGVLPPLPVALSAYPTLAESLRYQFTGLIVVFIALGSIWCLLELLALGFKWRARVAKVTVAAAAPVAAPLVAPAPAVTGELTPELVAAMAAAVHLTLGAGARISSIVRVEAPDGEWTREGRRQIHSARKVR